MDVYFGHPKSTKLMELWGRGTQAEHLQLCYFNILETCNTCFFTQITAFLLHSAGNFTRMLNASEASEEHVKCVSAEDFHFCLLERKT